VKNREELDVKKLSLDIIRDFYSASRKLVMYPMGHPNTNETLKKSVERLNEIFGIKRSFVLHTFAGRLLAEGILLEDNVFVNGLLLDLKKHDISSVVFKCELVLGDLYHFLNKLLEPKSPIEDHFQKYLNIQNVRTIEINSPQPSTLYDFDESAAGLANSKYLLEERLKALVSAKINLAVAHYLGKLNSDDQVTQYLGVDFRLSYLRRNLSTIISSLPETQVLEIFRQLIYSSNWLGQDSNVKALNGIKQLWGDYFPETPNYTILLPVYQTLKEVGAPRDFLDHVFDKAALIKLYPLIDADEIIGNLLANQTRHIDFEQLKKTIFRLASDQHFEQLNGLLRQLLATLSSTTPETRQRGLRLAMAAVDSLSDGLFWDVFSDFIKEMLQLAMSPAAGQEITELVERVAENTAANCRWQELKLSLQTLRGISRENDATKSAMATKRLESLANSPIILDILVEAIISGKSNAELYEAIACLASTKIASTLIEKIDSPDKAIRARIIKALAGMGKDVGPPATEVLAALIGPGETEDNSSWYRIRNLLRVIGLVKYIEALPYFEILAGWHQKRIKLELISALESMQSAATGSILSKLAVDTDPEVRKMAVIGMGMSGHPDMMMYIKNLFGNPQVDQVLLVAAIGRLGGPRARDMLIDLFENERYFQPDMTNRKDEEAIRLAIIKALSKIGDEIAKSKVDLYSRRWPAKDKTAIKDVLSNTAKVLLGDIPRSK
jgi:hypothetical protein